MSYWNVTYIDDAGVARMTKLTDPCELKDIAEEIAKCEGVHFNRILKIEKDLEPRSE